MGKHRVPQAPKPRGKSTLHSTSLHFSKKNTQMTPLSSSSLARATTNRAAVCSTSASPASSSRVTPFTHTRRTLAPALQAGKKAAGKAGKKEEKPEGLNLNLSFDDGVFAPAVRISIALVGLKDLNKFRGKAIALPSQVITSFCKQVGAPAKTKQGLIRLAKKNGHDLGFLVTTPAWTI